MARWGQINQTSPNPQNLNTPQPRRAGQGFTYLRARYINSQVFHGLLFHLCARVGFKLHRGFSSYTKGQLRFVVGRVIALWFLQAYLLLLIGHMSVMHVGFDMFETYTQICLHSFPLPMYGLRALAPCVASGPKGFKMSQLFWAGHE